MPTAQNELTDVCQGWNNNRRLCSVRGLITLLYIPSDALLLR